MKFKKIYVIDIVKDSTQVILTEKSLLDLQ